MRKVISRTIAAILVFAVCLSMVPMSAAAIGNSDQIVKHGGTNYYDADGSAVMASAVGENGAVVGVSKNIYDTGIENVFDIELKVQTSLKVEENIYISYTPDAAVVLIVDMSGTMYTGMIDEARRVEVAKEKAKEFVDQYAASAAGTSAKRMIAVAQFNTYAATLQGWIDVNTTSGLDTVLSVIDGITVDMDENDRCTNIESAMLLTNNLLNQTSIANKWAIVLSDGAPTVGIKSDEVDSTSTTKINNDNTNGGGTNITDVDQIKGYVDKIKEQATIYFIGVSEDMDKKLVDRDQSLDWSGVTPDVDKHSTTVGSWLADLGSYTPVYDTAALRKAFENIMNAIDEVVESATLVSKEWKVTDPIDASSVTPYVEFLGFYSDVSGYLMGADSISNSADGDEAALSEGVITWDLKNSAYAEENDVNTYSIKYRVRLMNEGANFVEGEDYITNGVTSFKYQTVSNNELSAVRIAQFPIPEIEGYLSELGFIKVDSISHKAVEGAQFELQHAHDCGCAAYGIDSYAAESDADGYVSFDRIPSGHKYVLSETNIVEGYLENTDTSSVTVAYDEITVGGDLVKSSDDGSYYVKNDPDGSTTITNNRREYYYRIWRYYTANIRGSISNFEDHDSDYTKTDIGAIEIDAADWNNCATDGKNSRIYTFVGPSTSVKHDGNDHPFSVSGKRVTFEIVEGDAGKYYYDVYLHYRYSVSDPTPTPPPVVPEYTSLTVNKIWNGDDDSAVRPDGITVALLKDGEATGETAVLSAESGWSHTWQHLAKENSWDVREVLVPEHYTSVKNVSADGKTVTIINTYTAPAIEAPEEEPPGIEIPDEEPPMIDIPKEEPPVVETPEEKPPVVETPEVGPPATEVPKTGDSALVWLLAGVSSVIGLAGLSFFGKRRKKNEEK